MTANAAGAVMTLYLSASGIEKRRFIGTNAWFFLIVNLVKVPFSVGLGLMHWADLGRARAARPAHSAWRDRGLRHRTPHQPAPLRRRRAPRLRRRGRCAVL